VGGALPALETVRRAAASGRVRGIAGVLNGTCNFVLDQLAEGSSFAEAVKLARDAGYAEADPTLDVNGWDAAHKAILLATLAYGFSIDPEKVHVAGIEQVRPIDIAFAKQLGYVVKLLAVIREHADGAIELRVQPSFVSKTHILASVNGVFNAIAVTGDVVGDTLFYGRGAGQDPTASAVISDLAEAALAIEAPRAHFGFTPHSLYGTCKPIGEIVSQYYLRIPVLDKPGVLAQVAGVLGRHDIGISSVIQPEGTEGEAVPLVLMIHDATNAGMQSALAEIRALPSVKAEPRLIRVETFHP